MNGEVSVTHSCPGEHLAVELIKMATQLLAATSYSVPDQDISVDLSRIPALPKSGFIISEIAGQTTSKSLQRAAQ